MQKGLCKLGDTLHKSNKKDNILPPFFVLVTFTNFYILANLRCCEPGGGVTKTDTSDEMKMENGYSDENVSTSKMTTSSKQMSQVPVEKKNTQNDRIQLAKRICCNHHFTQDKKEY